MRFMMLMIPAVYQGEKGIHTGKDFSPRAEEIEKMTRFNEELAHAGVLETLEGLRPPVGAVRVSFAGGKADVTYGPFVRSGDVLGGYWILRVASRDEAVEWAKRVPADNGDVIELRQIFEAGEFPEEARKAAESTTVREQVERFRPSA